MMIAHHPPPCWPLINRSSSFLHYTRVKFFFFLPFRTLIFSSSAKQSHLLYIITMSNTLIYNLQLLRNQLFYNLELLTNQLMQTNQGSCQFCLKKQYSIKSLCYRFFPAIYLKGYFEVTILRHVNSNHPIFPSWTKVPCLA